MILGDVIEYIFSGRAYYYAAKSDKNLKEFFKLNNVLCKSDIDYLIQSQLIQKLRKLYIEKLEETIPHDSFIEKEGDEELADK